MASNLDPQKMTTKELKATIRDLERELTRRNNFQNAEKDIKAVLKKYNANLNDLKLNQSSGTNKRKYTKVWCYIEKY